jgi:hypothetical protein
VEPVTWVPPFFKCGECGGEIGLWPMKNLLRQDILDWRHRTVPDGTAPHRAVLGTKAPHVALSKPVEEEHDEDWVEPDPVPPPVIPARVAEYTDPVPPSAKSLVKLAEEHGWKVEAWYMRGTRMDTRWKAGRVVSSVVVRMHRDGHRLVASWQTKGDLEPGIWWAAKDWPGVPFVPSFSPWGFDQAWSLTHEVEAIGSPELRKHITIPRAICDTCGEPPALHVLTDGILVCHALLTTPTKEVTP